MDWLVTIEMADMDDAQVRGNLLEILRAGLDDEVAVYPANGTTVRFRLAVPSALAAISVAERTLNWSFGVLQIPFPSITWLCAEPAT